MQSVFNESKGINERWEKSVIRGKMREENKMKDEKGVCVAVLQEEGGLAFM